MKLKFVLSLFLFFVVSSLAFSQNSFEFYQVGKVIKADKQMKINAKISGKISTMKLSGSMDMSEQKLYNVTVLEMKESNPSKMEVYIDESAEKQDMKMVVAGQPNNENTIKESPLKGKTILCANVNGTWEK